MDSLYLLIPVALIFVAVAVKLLLWAIDNGQYDDLDKEGWRILADDDKPAHSGDGQRKGDSPGADGEERGAEHRA
jgi:cbb3-type cytochrome oxidase maturation protein